MNKKLFSHECKRCVKTYLAYDKDKVFCSDNCESKFRFRQKHPLIKRGTKRTKEPKPIKEYVSKEKKPVITEQEKWLNKKSIDDRPKQDLQRIMYRDTFKKYIPKNLKVMRG